MNMPCSNTALLRQKELDDELADRFGEEPYFDDPVYVAAVLPKDLAKPIADLVAAKGCDVAVYEEARAAVEKALHTLWEDL